MIHLVCLNPALDRTLILEDFKDSYPNRPKEVRDFPGGKSFNVAYALNTENPEAQFLIHTLLGGDIGEYVKFLAKKNNMPLVITPTPNNTRTCSILFDTLHNQVFPVYENGIPVSQSIVDKFTETLLSKVSEGDTIIFSGSFAKGFPEDYISYILNQVKPLQIHVGIDSSGSALQKAFFAKPNLVKINDEELLDIFPDFVGNNLIDYVDLMKDKRDILPSLFIVTLGKSGVLAKVQNHLFHVVAKQIDAKNPIASGDFFLGALLANKDNNTDVVQMVKRAIAYSTANCLNLYPEVKMEDINRIFEEELTVTHFDF